MRQTGRGSARADSRGHRHGLPRARAPAQRCACARCGHDFTVAALVRAEAAASAPAFVLRQLEHRFAAAIATGPQA
jgi:hypothetical protein